MTRRETKVVVGNARGVHGRVATRLAEIAANNKVRLTLRRNGDCIDSAAILEVLALALVQGTEITLCAAPAMSGGRDSSLWSASGKTRFV